MILEAHVCNVVFFAILKGLDRVQGSIDVLGLAPRHARLLTSGRALKLLKPRHHTLERNMFFSSRIVNPWNKLLEGVINSTSINSVKNDYD